MENNLKHINKFDIKTDSRKNRKIRDGFRGRVKQQGSSSNHQHMKLSIEWNCAWELIFVYV